MEAIKKKMQAMKVEKDNAMDRCDVCEEASKAARVRAEKAEEEVMELMNKARQLETELDVTSERFSIISMQLEEKEKQGRVREGILPRKKGRRKRTKNMKDEKGRKGKGS